MLGTTIVGFRTDRPAVADVRVRRAIAAAVAEVAADAERIGLGARPPGRGGLLPPAMPGPQLQPGLAADDGRGPEALLADAGHPDGEGLGRLRMLATAGTAQQAEALVEALGQLGSKARIDCSDPDVILSGQDCDVWVCTWFADFPDPEGFFRGLVGDPDRSDREGPRGVRAASTRRARAATATSGCGSTRRRPPARGRRGD